MARAAALLVCCCLSLLSTTVGQTRILTGADNDPLKCYTADGVVGDCRPWRYCRVVRQQYPKKKPTICLYRPKNPIVCCPRKSSGKFTTTRRPVTKPRPAANPWRPIPAPRPQPAARPQPPARRPQGQGHFNFGEPTTQRPKPAARPQSQGQFNFGEQAQGQFNFGEQAQGDRPPRKGTPRPKPQGRPQSRPQQRPQSRPQKRPQRRPNVSSTGPTSERLQQRGYIGHKDCGLVTLAVRADFDQLELRRRRRRRSPLDRSHAAPPSPDRSHASAPTDPTDPFAIFDSLVFSEEEEDLDFTPYTEEPPAAAGEAVDYFGPGSVTESSGSGGQGSATESPGGQGSAAEGADPSGGQPKYIRVKILPHEPGAGSLVYGDAEEGYEVDYYDLPASVFEETFLIRTRTGKSLEGDDPYGIYSQEYRDKVSGQLKDVHYITAGEDAIVGRWPWIALIGERLPSKISWFCGGAILNEEYIVTAAHCLGRFQKNRLVVRVGEFDLNYDTDAAHQDLLVDRIIMHPKYVHRRKHHDIALLHLSRPVRLGGQVQPVCLPPRGVDLTGETTTVAGWGHTEFGGEKSAVLQQVRLPLVNTTACEDRYRTLGDVFQADFAPGFGDTKICAQDTTGGGRDACQGDSGGPMTYRDPASGRVQLIGVVSSGVGCGHPKFPGVYTRVAMYVDWILERAFKER